MLWFFVIGIIAGCIFGNIMKDGELGLVGDLVGGLGGAFIGGYLPSFLGVADHGAAGEMAMAAVGSIGLLFAMRLLPMKSHFIKMRKGFVDAERRIYDGSCSGKKCDEKMD